MNVKKDCWKLNVVANLIVNNRYLHFWEHMINNNCVPKLAFSLMYIHKSFRNKQIENAMHQV